MAVPTWLRLDEPHGELGDDVSDKSADHFRAVGVEEEDVNEDEGGGGKSELLHARPRAIGVQGRRSPRQEHAHPRRQLSCSPAFAALEHYVTPAQPAPSINPDCARGPALAGARDRRTALAPAGESTRVA